ncbi:MULTISPECIES: 2-phosphoglycerate kinase [unclassified Anabaena]|uniref:2-phosphoglycerate kinase n=1 Tax=unclassified Anabaena TaxID=2619674 RepID=UPI0039C6E439
MRDEQKLLLIGGSSHVGKSTLAQSLASHFRWNDCSTDKLARHPGRPWQIKSKDIPQHVAEHYQLLSADELIEDVFHHYKKNVWPLIENIVTSHTTDASSKKMVMEGSALLPELVITLNFDNISSIWLTACNDFLRRRIYTASQYETKSPYEKMLIDKFWERNCLYNQRIIDDINQLGLLSLNVENVSNTDELMSLCLSTLSYY